MAGCRRARRESSRICSVLKKLVNINMRITDIIIEADKKKQGKKRRGPASKELCRSSKPDSQLGASNLASCKSQGLRARDGKKSHKIGDKRVTVGDKKIKGKDYGGPLPDWS